MWERKDGIDLIAGYPWYESITRQTLTALPGIFLILGDVKNFEAVLQTNLKRLRNGLLQNMQDRKASSMLPMPLCSFSLPCRDS